MSYWGFFAVKGKSFIGLTNDKKIKEAILRDRKEDFFCVKLEKKPTENMIRDYSFNLVEISDNHSVPMTTGEEEAFYAYGYLQLMMVYDKIEHVRKLVDSIRLDRIERHEFLLSIINIYKYINNVLNCNDEFDEKAWSCANAYNKDKLWEDFRTYEREEDETLERLYTSLMDA